MVGGIPYPGGNFLIKVTGGVTLRLLPRAVEQLKLLLGNLKEKDLQDSVVAEACLCQTT